jgi:hypothetical protein
MFGLRSDMFGIGQICLVWGPDSPVTRNFVQRKSRSEVKTMRLGSDKLTVSKIDNMKLREITGTIRSNINSSIQL